MFMLSRAHAAPFSLVPLAGCQGLTSQVWLQIHYDNQPSLALPTSKPVLLGTFLGTQH